MSFLWFHIGDKITITPFHLPTRDKDVIGNISIEGPDLFTKHKEYTITQIVYREIVEGDGPDLFVRVLDDNGRLSEIHSSWIQLVNRKQNHTYFEVNEQDYPSADDSTNETNLNLTPRMKTLIRQLHEALNEQGRYASLYLHDTIELKKQNKLKQGLV